MCNSWDIFVFILPFLTEGSYNTPATSVSRISVKFLSHIFLVFCNNNNNNNIHTVYIHKHECSPK